jgi:DNA-binding LacI/PurR family transcriptional regulator
MVKGKNGKSAPPRREPAAGTRVSLRGLAEYLGVSSATISAVINNSPVADRIPQQTKDCVLAAVRKFNYRANFNARSLRQQRSFTIGVLVPQISEGYSAQVLGGIEDQLLEEGYVYIVASHHHRPDLLERHPAMLLERSVEGIIVVDTPFAAPLPVPVVAVSGHYDVEGVTNIVVDHDHATTLALEHLYALGHRDIAFIKGEAFSTDTEIRWNATMRSAARLGLAVSPALCTQLEPDSPPSSKSGHAATQRLLAAKKPFTAVFAFNDVSAIGAIRALREAGRRVPEDVSVVGFDDIPSAAFQIPALTTVRQPLREMGKRAAETVLYRISRPNGHRAAKIVVQPKLVFRESTCQCRTLSAQT